MIPLALLPRYVAKAYKFLFMPSDLDRVRYIHKINPDHDFVKDRHRGGVAHLKRSFNHGRSSRRKSKSHFNGSHTDMATGLRSVHRGFDFATEENGVALKRLQSNLSERQAMKTQRKGSLSLPHFSFPRSMRRKKPPLETVHDEEVVGSIPSTKD